MCEMCVCAQDVLEVTKVKPAGMSSWPYLRYCLCVWDLSILHCRGEDSKILSELSNICGHGQPLLMLLFFCTVRCAVGIAMACLSICLTLRLWGKPSWMTLARKHGHVNCHQRYQTKPTTVCTLHIDQNFPATDEIFSLNCIQRTIIKYTIANHIAWKQISWRIQRCKFKSINIWKSYWKNTKGFRSYEWRCRCSSILDVEV